MKRSIVRTAAEARALLELQGVTVGAWAKEHGFSHATVGRVLAGAVRGRFGQSHKIMVALGMKSTTVTDDDVTAYAREHYRNT